MMNGNSGRKRFMSEINVTPFVDVMLVLLIIFMVTAPLMIQGVDVNLPKTETKEIKTIDDPLVLTVNKKREISIERRKIEYGELDTKLKSIFKYRNKKDLFLRADKDLPYGYVIQVVAKVKKAGIDIGLVMVTEPVD
ncbi:ExbD/TolR family protein [Thermodesulfobacteriota bacterium]